MHGCLNGAGAGRVCGLCGSFGLAVPSKACATSCRPVKLQLHGFTLAVLSVDAYCLAQDLPILPRKGALPFRLRTAPR